MSPLRILHIEDEKWFHSLVKGAISEHSLIWAASLAEAQTLLKAESFDLILLDRNLGSTDSFDQIPHLVSLCPDAILLVLSSDNDGSAIQKAIELGAHDYLIKTPTIADELALRIQIAKKARDSARLLEQQNRIARANSKIIGSSEHTKALQDKTLQLSKLDIHILITGESGTGKEVIASEIHRQRGEKLRPFIAINCGAISETVFESELFGHVKGAFTGADANREGLLAAANGGDLFLDEIGDLPSSQQVKLLRFLQEGTYTPVGSTQLRHSKVRVIAATHKNLEEEVKKGTFREDLFYRLDVYRIHTKPLRERTEDIAPLADFFVSHFSDSSRKINLEAKRLLEKQVWRGNVRELAAVIQRALVEAGSEDVRANHIRVQNIDGQGLSLSLPKQKASIHRRGFDHYLDTAAKTYLEAALGLYEGDTLGLSKALQMSRATIYNKIKKLKMRNKSS